MTPPPDVQLQDEEDAAMLRDAGRSWSHIADTLGVSVHLAKKLAAAGDQRAYERAHQNQQTLF